jgi:hypothetical protein
MEKEEEKEEKKKERERGNYDKVYNRMAKRRFI